MDLNIDQKMGEEYEPPKSVHVVPFSGAGHTLGDSRTPSQPGGVAPSLSTYPHPGMHSTATTTTSAPVQTAASATSAPSAPAVAPVDLPGLDASQPTTQLQIRLHDGAKYALFMAQVSMLLL